MQRGIETPYGAIRAHPHQSAIFDSCDAYTKTAAGSRSKAHSGAWRARYRINWAVFAGAWRDGRGRTLCKRQSHVALELSAPPAITCISAAYPRPPPLPMADEWFESLYSTPSSADTNSLALTTGERLKLIYRHDNGLSPAPHNSVVRLAASRLSPAHF